MDFEEIEKLFKLMRNYKIKEFESHKCKVKCDVDEEEIDSKEYNDMIEKLNKAVQVSDDEIMFNPYAGMETNDG